MSSVYLCMSRIYFVDSNPGADSLDTNLIDLFEDEEFNGKMSSDAAGESHESKKD